MILQFETLSYRFKPDNYDMESKNRMLGTQNKKYTIFIWSTLSFVCVCGGLIEKHENPKKQ